MDTRFSAELQNAIRQDQLGASPHTVIEGYNALHAMWPQQIEPIYYLARYYNSCACYKQAYDTIRDWARQPPCSAGYPILREFALCAFRLGYHDDALKACAPLIDIPSQHVFVELLQKACKGIRAPVCLNMIVRNEARVIRRCIESVRPIVDHWVIVDTGSTDGTQDVVYDALRDIPGTLYQRPWVDFGHNRSEALELAMPCADYLLFMDADDYLEFDGPATLPPLLSDVYVMWNIRNWRWNHHLTRRYGKIKLVRSELPWKWTGVVHERLHCDAPTTSELLTTVHYCIGLGGARSHDPTTAHIDAQLLEETHPDTAHDLFHTATSCQSAGKTAKALEYYSKLIAKGGNFQFLFWAQLQTARLLHSTGEPIQRVVEAYIAAHHASPRRAEPIYFLAHLYNSQHDYESAYTWLTSYTPQTIQDIGFSYPWVDEYGVQCELALAAYYTGRYEKALAAATAAISCPNLPSSWHWQLERIRDWSAKAKQKSE